METYHLLYRLMSLVWIGMAVLLNVSTSRNWNESYGRLAKWRRVKIDYLDLSHQANTSDDDEPVERKAA